MEALVQVGSTADFGAANCAIAFDDGGSRLRITLQLGEPEYLSFPVWRPTAKCVSSASSPTGRATRKGHFEKKAKDIRGHIADAVKQLPNGKKRCRPCRDGNARRRNCRIRTL